ncbi:hypothetical protein [Candidatus Enterococcus ikei]|uniref:Uncharacterized protein n=1 Tax=Candidatus Enterococcus ikei TaxID=2815326 RepID=A0ABS3GZL2_9ENTE|nr:hypothetical protein [Enterococcus sp. DIV0869a]MBO0440285.1 hypothetical protein [Enterococcus sp. DIV0869a]
MNYPKLINLLTTLFTVFVNDSDGVIWKKLEDLDENNSSPLILKIKEEIAQENEMEKYENFNWIVNE